MMGSRKDYERPPVANIPIGQMVAIAFVATVAIAIVLGVEEPPINFCPDVCDSCVDKEIKVPETDIKACGIVWDKMSQGESPRFTGFIEQDMCISPIVVDLTPFECSKVWEQKLLGINYGRQEIWDRKQYLYTYQIQNAVQFDYCIQEYYKQHFGGDE